MVSVWSLPSFTVLVADAPHESTKFDEGRSWTIYAQADSPGADKESNRLRAPKDADCSITIRAYLSKVAITDGS